MLQRRHAFVLLIASGLGVLAAIGFAWITCVPNDTAMPTQLAIAPAPMNAPELIHLMCGGCHSNGRTKVDLDGYLDLRVVGRDTVTWRRVIRQLRSGDMPPPKSPHLASEERARIVTWVEDGLAQAAAADRGRVMARRLRKAEYVHAIKDLLGVQVAADIDLPSDEDIGWDRCNDLPALADDAQALYQAASKRILDEAALAPVIEISTAGADRRCACDVVAALARRAFRRPLRADELAELDAICEQAAHDGMTVDETIKGAVHWVLTSPHFLQRIEILPDAVHADPGSGPFALASRLSFLLWNSLPDDELLDQAQKGTLSANLEAQAMRMLRDPRARRLAVDFAGKWLGLDKVARWYVVEEALERSMRKETELFVAAIVQEDRSVLEFLDADYSFLNDRLARHYGLTGVVGEEMRRVSLAGTPRGGLLTQASILTATSTAARQSPVLRGKWIMENLLGTPPPAPPFGLLEAFADTRKSFGPGTARQMLEQHRAHESCAYCHVQMDALGIALENFDPVGAWRTHENGWPIDASVVLPGGERLDGQASVKAYLLERTEMFIRCLSGKLLEHALGRRLNHDDRLALDAIPAKVAQSGYRFSSVVEEVVKSPPFLCGVQSPVSDLARVP